MAITTGSKISVALQMAFSGNVAMNIWQYSVLEIVGTPNAAHYAQAWWNHVKTAYRALALTAWSPAFVSVRVSELVAGVGEYGEYGIPSAEQGGTRTAPTDADPSVSFNAAGVRLTVGTNATRPGQKRFPFLTQQDQTGQTLGSAYTALLVTLMNTMTTNLTLGAPAAGVVLVPNVVRLNPDGSVAASQFVTGYSINPYVTSQVSRKQNRGI